MDGWLERIRKQTTQVIANSRGGKEKKRRIGEKNVSLYRSEKNAENKNPFSLYYYFCLSVFLSKLDEME